MNEYAALEMTWLCLLLYKSSLSKHRCPGLRLPNSNLSSGPTQSTAMSLQQLERNLWTPGLTHHGAHHPAHVDRSAAARAVLASILQELGVGVQEHQANIQDPIFKLSEGADSEDPQPLQPPPHLLPLTQQPGRECRGRKWSGGHLHSGSVWGPGCWHRARRVGNEAPQGPRACLWPLSLCTAKSRPLLPRA